MDTFEDFFKSGRSPSDRGDLSGKLPQTKIQRGTVGVSRLNQRIVPDSATVDMSVNSKVERLKDLNTSIAVPISNIEVRQISSDYNISNLTKTSPRELGTTKIIIYYDSDKSSFMLKKKEI